MSIRRSVSLVAAILFIAVLACTAPVPSTPKPVEDNQSFVSEPAVAAVALRLDGNQRQLSSFLGPNTAVWDLEPGHYLISAVDQNGLTIVFSDMQIVDVPLIWPPDFNIAGSPKNRQQAQAITTLVNFLMTVEEAKLTALENSSAGFSAPLFATEPGQTELDELYARYAEISGQEAEVMRALDVILALTSKEKGYPRLARPSPDWKETLFGIFGYAGNSGARARERILEISKGLSPEE
jgi:hypothetical protein